MTTPARINLADNTNAWGMPPAARAVSPCDASGYPTPYADELKAAISGYTGVPADMITTGCGSDDVLDSAIRAFGGAGARLAWVEPTFVMIPIFARLNGLEPVATTLDAIGRAGARIIYLCSPNNPTGELVPRARIDELQRGLAPGAVMIVDEAYAEFSGSSVIDLAARCDNVLVTRTMSKAFGLAGLRVGYGIGNPALIEKVERSRGPYKVAAASERIAAAALATDLEWMSEHASRAVELRQRLADALRARGFAPRESAANFVYVPLANAPAIAAKVRERGIAMRAFDDPPALRITVAPWPMLEEAIAALDDARAACA